MVQVETIEQDQHDIAVVHIKGELTTVTVDQLRKELAVLLGQHVRFFVLNLEAVEFIDSSGLGSIISITKRIRDLQGDVKVAALQPTTQQLFKTVKADRHFPKHNTVDDALRSLSARLSRPTTPPPKKTEEEEQPSRFRRWRWF